MPSMGDGQIGTLRITIDVGISAQYSVSHTEFRCSVAHNYLFSNSLETRRYQTSLPESGFPCRLQILPQIWQDSCSKTVG